jgi:hypothetical protein
MYTNLPEVPLAIKGITIPINIRSLIKSPKGIVPIYLRTKAEAGFRRAKLSNRILQMLLLPRNQREISIATRITVAIAIAIAITIRLVTPNLLRQYHKRALHILRRKLD